MAAVKIQIYLGSVYVGDTALVVKILVIVSEIRFPEIRLRIIDDELDFLFRGEVEHFFNFTDILWRFEKRVFG